jgi:hypothetical protein
LIFFLKNNFFQVQIGLFSDLCLKTILNFVEKR